MQLVDKKAHFGVLFYLCDYPTKQYPVFVTILVEFLIL